jgi:hypothetical protein
MEMRRRLRCDSCHGGVLACHTLVYANARGLTQQLSFCVSIQASVAPQPGHRLPAVFPRGCRSAHERAARLPAAEVCCQLVRHPFTAVTPLLVTFLQCGRSLPVDCRCVCSYQEQILVRASNPWFGYLTW